jgi:hypothetical protein
MPPGDEIMFVQYICSPGPTTDHDHLFVLKSYFGDIIISTAVCPEHNKVSVGLPKIVAIK